MTDTEKETTIKHSYRKIGVHPPSKEVYPITHQFDLDTIHININQRSLTISQIRSVFAEVIGEYEHGSADVEDLIPENPINVTQLSAVLRDAILCLEHWVFPEEENES